jgi:hypothetical protein
MQGDAGRRMLKVGDAATFLGLSVSYLNLLRVRGGGPAFLKMGRAVCYDPVDLEKWAAAKRRVSTSDDGGAK